MGGKGSFSSVPFNQSICWDHLLEDLASLGGLEVVILACQPFSFTNTHLELRLRFLQIK